MKAASRGVVARLKAGLTTTTMDQIAMARHRLTQIPTIHITTASRVLAMLRARKAVKRQLQAQGLKVSATLPPTSPD
jgi:hypothetical protein